jgi:hypothetical protein
VRLKSRGLGRKELVMDFREYDVVREGNEILVVGTIRDPVNWEFSIRMCEDDIAGVARIAARKSTLALVLRSIFKPKKHHHWNDDRAEHVAGAKARRKAAVEKFAERARAAEEKANRAAKRSAPRVNRTAEGEAS